MYFAHPKEWSNLAEKYPQYSGKQISDLIRCQVKTQNSNIKIRASVTKPIQTASAVHCFVAGTLVKTKDGDKAIENVCVGDYVWAFDPETGETALKMVIRTFVNETDELIIVKIGDEIIETTPEHPFYVLNCAEPRATETELGVGWVKAKNLRSGDTLLLLDGSTITIDSVTSEHL